MRCFQHDIEKVMVDEQRGGVEGCFMLVDSWAGRQTQQLARFIAITDTMRILYCTERSTICPCSLGLRGWVVVGV